MNVTNTYDVLLLDSNAAVRDRIETALAGSGFLRVLAVGGARQAITQLQRSPFDALIAALELNDIDDAWKLVRMVRSGRFCSDRLPVIALCDRRAAVLEALAKEHDSTLVEIRRADALPEHVREVVNGRVKPRLLIIEDDRNAAASARLALEKAFHVDVVHDGLEGYERWRSADYDLVLLDVMLPSLSGPEILERIHDSDTDQVVIVITAYANPDRHQELVFGGATEFIEKPYNVGTLRETCEKVLRHHSLRRSYEQDRASDRVLSHVAQRVQVADYQLSRGQPGRAAYHIRNALAAVRPRTLSDDEWAELIAQFE